MSRRIEIVEVGPRDGLQNEAKALSVDDRLEFIRRAAPLCSFNRKTEVKCLKLWLSTIRGPFG